jgi:hypothetical protein
MDVEPDDRFEERTRAEAAARGWKFEKVCGDLSMLQRLVNGQWDGHEFLIVPPGYQVVATHDSGIVTASIYLPPEGDPQEGERWS